MKTLSFGLLLLTSFQIFGAPERISDTKPFLLKLNKGKLSILGKEWQAEKFCNEDTIDNPETLEAFKTGDSSFEVAVLCPGMMDGEENVVTVFSAKLEPRSMKVRPGASTSKITPEVLTKTIEELIGKK